MRGTSLPVGIMSSGMMWEWLDRWFEQVLGRSPVTAANLLTFHNYLIILMNASTGPVSARVDPGAVRRRTA